MPLMPLDESRPFSDDEAALLAAAGFRDEPRMAALALENARRALDELLSDVGSLSVAQASTLLGATSSSVVERLAVKRTMYGIKHDGEWRIPRFQFEGSKLVRNIESVLPWLPLHIHPLAVRSFFLSTCPDLVVENREEEEAMSPLVWLSAGHAADSVRALAQEL